MPISASLRQQVVELANHRCEYCLLHEDYALKKHEPDHLLPTKHGGSDLLDHLVWACFSCNRHKGSDVAAFDLETGELSRLFNPKVDEWNEHFELDEAEIRPKTIIGRVTVLVLQLNRPNRVLIREELIAVGRYP